MNHSNNNRTNYRTALLIAIALLTWTPVIAFAQYTSTPIDAALLPEAPYRYTGLLTTETSSCSGAVVVDKRLFLSASHCVFNSEAATGANPWLPSPEWFLRYHSPTFPQKGSGQQTRGYWIFTNYADTVRSLGIASREAYDLDFLTAYAFEPLAEEAAGYWQDGYEAIMHYPWKQTLGYPSGNYPNPHPSKYLMHQNGPWTASCQSWHESYIECDEVSAGPGNSGGPVFVYYPEDSKYYYAGNVTSGFRRANGDPYDNLGINTVRSAEWELVNSAKEAAINGANQTPPTPTPTPLPTANPTLAPTPAPKGGQRLAVYGNTELVPPGRAIAYRSDNTNYGTVTGKRSVTRTFTVFNYGSSDLHFPSTGQIKFFGRGRQYFRYSNRLPSRLAPQQSHAFKITFRNSPRSKYKIGVWIHSDDPENPVYSFAIMATRR